jgi:hypothetical protein
MKRLITLISFVSLFLTTGCDWFEEGDLLEVYFGVRQNVSSIEPTTTFYYDNENDLTFNLDTQVYFRLDFLYIPRLQDSQEIKSIELSFENTDDYFISPVLSLDLELKTIGSTLVYEMPLQKNQYVSYFFSIETLIPTSIQLELNSSILMEQVSANPLNQQSITSEDLSYEVVKKGFNVILNTLHFQTIPSIRRIG